MKAFASLFLLVAMPPLLLAQSTGLIVGVIEDRSGALVPGAEIRAINELTDLQWATVSDEAGRFNLPRLPVGNYRVRVSKQGFRQFVSESFRLDADQSRRIVAVLEYSHDNGSEIRFSPRSAPLRTPFFCNTTIQDIVRTRSDVQKGNRMQISISAPTHPLEFEMT